MKVLKCDECGCHIPSGKVFKRIDRIQEKGMMSEEEAKKAKEKIKQENPYVKCHNPDCSGFLQPVKKDEVQADLSRFKTENRSKEKQEQKNNG